MSSGTIPDEPLWTAKDVAAYLKVSQSWVYSHAEDGSLPSVKICGLRRFVPAQVRAYALGQPVPPLNVLDFSRAKGR